MTILEEKCPFILLWQIAYSSWNVSNPKSRREIVYALIAAFMSMRSVW